MSLFSESKLKGFRNSTRYYAVNIEASLREFKSESKSSKTTVFLSHKHDELELLDGAVSFLKKEGVNVYVDWMDDGMPKYTSGVTALRIKEKIKENSKFILLASEGAISSKWCNWELGLGDAERYKDDIAILPVSGDYSSFSGSEYLQIYPYIEYQNGNAKFTDGTSISEGYYVRNPAKNGSSTIVKLQDWLNR
ncbi:toll/interleukin-1 receptor domain-containing protein [Labilibaculum sp.]|uniref:toll/interleukin-1 receptor domain-containing protein n=1 Tax=Labilibaculum sp. TaxID=2060723 RepID=UPI002AA94DD1|nr:toll/interleukin-1 receptor domain-containing protein [Labilibaculum sp.]